MGKATAASLSQTFAHPEDAALAGIRPLPLDDSEDGDAAPSVRHRKRGPRKPRAATRSGG